MLELVSIQGTVWNSFLFEAIDSLNIGPNISQLEEASWSPFLSGSLRVIRWEGTFLKPEEAETIEKKYPEGS